jgi:hypothetical protein
MDGTIPDFLKRLQNKLTYYIYKTVNDDEANQYAEQKQPKEQPTEIKEELTAADIPIAPTTVDKLDISRIFDNVYNKGSELVSILFYPILSLYLASLVANELIVYPAPIRLIFFILVLVLCNIFVYIPILMTGFYICKKLYEMYLNREQDPPQPPVKLMPKIFAMVPFTTYTSDNGLVNLFLYPFRYLKGNNAEKDLSFLQVLMKKYTDSLNESFPYYEVIRTTEEIFVDRKKNFDKMEDDMHKITKPKEAPKEPNQPNQSNMSKEPANAPLPAVIEQKEAPLENQPNKAPLPKESANAPLPKEPVNAPLPAIIEQKKAPLANKPNNASLPKESANAPLPNQAKEAPLPKESANAPLPSVIEQKEQKQ